uniref:ABC transporter ATP-binding protein n=1 Tax=Pedobacter schmidteae TaxID=2201271 RepID=UPI000EB419B7|nr:ABC transporter ATP-binding protein [Pedobacter schmidteae]
MCNLVIKAENLSKAYQLGEIGTGTLSRDLERWWAKLRGKADPFLRIGETKGHKGPNGIVWSLKDLDFEIDQGDAVGIIGSNGAGKSTLLKILSRVTAPTTGSVKVKGRIASLLEIGTGFHPELTGRENIFLNGAILGMRKAEIKHKFDEIVNFSGVERYIDTPVKRYSSGMYVRLAFAVAAHLESEILIVDEVLAVGDMEFQKKCLGKMDEVSKGEGRTVLFVSHNMGSIETLCKKGIYLNGGKIEAYDNVTNVVDLYLNTKNKYQNLPLIYRKDRTGIGNVKINAVFLESGKAIVTGQPLNITAQYEKNTDEDIAIKEFGVSIWTEREIKLISLSTEFKGELADKTIPTSGSVTCTIHHLPLVEGAYILNFFISSQYGIEDYITNCLNFNVEYSNFYTSGKSVHPEWGAIAVNHNWEIQ